VTDRVAATRRIASAIKINPQRGSRFDLEAGKFPSERF